MKRMLSQQHDRSYPQLSDTHYLCSICRVLKTNVPKYLETSGPLGKTINVLCLFPTTNEERLQSFLNTFCHSFASCVGQAVLARASVTCLQADESILTGQQLLAANTDLISKATSLIQNAVPCSPGGLAVKCPSPSYATFKIQTCPF